MKMDHDL